MTASLKNRLKAVKLLVLDVDGVLTDGSIIYNGTDREIKAFNVQDGFGVTLARTAGLQTAILTGRVSPPVEARAKELRFDFYQAGHFHKLDALFTIQQQAGVSADETLYMGDDILDLVCRPHVGIFVAPANARERVKGEADWVTTASGGHGAVREMIEGLLTAMGCLWETEAKLLEQKHRS